MYRLNFYFVVGEKDGVEFRDVNLEIRLKSAVIYFAVLSALLLAATIGESSHHSTMPKFATKFPSGVLSNLSTEGSCQKVRSFFASFLLKFIG